MEVLGVLGRSLGGLRWSLRRLGELLGGPWEALGRSGEVSEALGRCRWGLLGRILMDFWRSGASLGLWTIKLQICCIVYASSVVFKSGLESWTQVHGTPGDGRGGPDLQPGVPPLLQGERTTPG